MYPSILFWNKRIWCTFRFNSLELKLFRNRTTNHSRRWVFSCSGVYLNSKRPRKLKRPVRQRFDVCWTRVGVFRKVFCRRVQWNSNKQCRFESLQKNINNLDFVCFFFCKNWRNSLSIQTMCGRQTCKK